MVLTVLFEFDGRGVELVLALVTVLGFEEEEEASCFFFSANLAAFNRMILCCCSSSIITDRLCMAEEEFAVDPALEADDEV